MNLVFADTQFFVGIISPHNQWHENAALAEVVVSRILCK